MNHLNCIISAEEVLEIKVTNSYEDVSTVVKYSPIGALALAAATVSILSLWINEASTFKLREHNFGLMARWGTLAGQ